MKAEDVKILVNNKRAAHEYFIEKVYEAGIELKGTEVKSIRNSKANLADAYANVKDGEVFVYNMHISPYEMGNRYNVDPLRIRRLLLHKREIRYIRQALEQKGYTLIPLNLHLVKSYVKMDIALARGKKLYDKRESLKKKDAARDIERNFKNKY